MLLSACSGDPGHPTTLPTLTPSATPSRLTTPSPSDLEAATQVVRTYYALLNAATTNANADALAHLMTPSCKCQEVVRSTREVASKNQHYFGNTIVRDLHATRDSLTLIEVLVSYDYGHSGIADVHGHELKSYAGRRGASADFSVIKSGRSWLIDGIVYVNKGQPA